MRAGKSLWQRWLLCWAPVLAGIVVWSGLMAPWPAQGAGDRQPPVRQIWLAEPGGIGGVGG